MKTRSSLIGQNAATNGQEQHSARFALYIRQLEDWARIDVQLTSAVCIPQDDYEFIRRHHDHYLVCLLVNLPK